MSNLVEVTQAMVDAALAAGKASGALAGNARAGDVRRLIAAALGEAPVKENGVRFNLLVNTAITVKKARFLGATGQRCYYRVECEDGQILTVHGNEIHADGGTRQA
jgi:hypothetical protein